MKQVIIIGGGFAGSLIAQKLEHCFHVSLIDAKDYFEYTPGILRALVDPQHSRNIQVLHSHYLKSARVIRGEVEEVTEKEVIVDGKKLHFDYLVICSGSSYEAPIKEEHVVISKRADTLRNCYHQLRKARSVLIIGGGLVGVELAAEISTHYREKEVVIVESKGALMERQPLKVHQFGLRFLQKRGVKVLFREKVVQKEGNCYKTQSGKCLEADISFLCTGIKPNFHFLEKHFPGLVTKKGHLLVERALQVPGHSHFFAAGDIVAIPEEKTAQNAEHHAEIVARNILHLERNEPLEEYHPRKRAMVISLGKHAGILTTGDFVITGFLPGLLKRFIEWKVMRRYKNGGENIIRAAHC